MDPAAIIREARRRTSLTQRELSRRAGTSQPAVARYESGEVEPSPSTLRRLLRACGFDLRVELVPLDPAELDLLKRNLRMTHRERLDQLMDAVAFIEAGRHALGDAHR